MTAATRTHRVVLAGASGMLGQAILRNLGHRSEVAVLALYREPVRTCESANICAVMVDFDSDKELAATLKEFGPTALIQAAATGMQTPRPSAATLRAVNVELPLRMARAVTKLDHCSFIQVSSGLAYKDCGRPLREDDRLETKHPYGASKAEAESELLPLTGESKLNLTVVRPFSFTGEGDYGSRLFPALLQSAVDGSAFKMSPGLQVRDHSSVDDIAAGTVAATLHRMDGASLVYNLGNGDMRTLRELVNSVIDQLGLKMDVEFGGRPMIADEPMFMVPDITLARTALAWEPRENIAHAVWRLARKSFPSLQLREPQRLL